MQVALERADVADVAMRVDVGGNNGGGIGIVGVVVNKSDTKRMIMRVRSAVARKKQ